MGCSYAHRGFVVQGLLLASVMLACAGPASAQQAELDFTGRWDTTYGRLVLEQKGKEVTGSYSYASSGGALQGTVEKKTLSFTYTEMDGTTGEGVFELASSGQAFEGKWRPTGGSGWQPWNGTRDRSEPPPNAGDLAQFNGLFATSYGRMRLVQKGKKVSGTYQSSAPGTLSGEVSKGRFTFTYEEAGAKGEGWFELSSDGMALTGQWRTGTGAAWKPWTGTRVFAEPNVRWLIILETHWERSIAENEYSFGEMLRSYFERMPHVRVRQRRIADKADFLRAGAEIAYLAEPVTLLISGHGSPKGLDLSGDRLTEKEVLQLLSVDHTVELLHFSSCDILGGDIPQKILDGLPSGRKPVISGYAEPVDWSASAVFEMLYLDLVVGRHIDPKTAGDIVLSEMNFADDSPTEGSPFGVLRFRLLEP